MCMQNLLKQRKTNCFNAIIHKFFNKMLYYSKILIKEVECQNRTLERHCKILIMNAHGK